MAGFSLALRNYCDNRFDTRLRGNPSERDDVARQHWANDQCRGCGHTGQGHCEQRRSGSDLHARKITLFAVNDLSVDSPPMTGIGDRVALT
jgi:hypothetical protein